MNRPTPETSTASVGDAKGRLAMLLAGMRPEKRADVTAEHLARTHRVSLGYAEKALAEAWERWRACDATSRP